MNKLQEACIISHEHWLKEIEQTIVSIDIEIPEIKIPENAKEKIVPINKKNSTISKKVIKVLIIAAIIVSLLMTVSAFTPFREFVIEFFENYNSFSNDGAETYYPKGIEITNLPEGFVLIKEDVNSLIILQDYECGEKRITVQKATANAYHRVNNTDKNPEIYEYGTIKYYLYIHTDTVVEVIWLTDKYSYVIVGYNMTDKELLEFAKGIS